MSELCQVCKTEGLDRRTLSINTGYDLMEVSPLFKKVDHEYIITMCKGCRAMLHGFIAQWIVQGGRLADSHLDDDGISGYTLEEVEQGLAGPELQAKLNIGTERA